MTKHVVEEPVVFECTGLRLVGILHLPEISKGRAVLIVVGGPQYRVGSHRQFLLLARALADEGFPVLRFDYRGMGDSDGADVTFEDIEPDIRSGIDLLYARVSGLEDIVIWGLCDAASAAMLYAYKDSRVSGLVLVNPWARTEESIARTYLHHYYRSRLLDPSLWRRIFTGKVNIIQRLGEFWQTYRQVLIASGKGEKQQVIHSDSAIAPDLPYTERMCKSLDIFSGQVLFILSGNDLVTAEFSDCVAESGDWQRLMKRPGIERQDFAEANHTFSRKEWRDQVAIWTVDWLKAW